MLTLIFFFIIGACLGSFLNVCIYRLPLHKSLLNPPSHCAACGAPIPWRNNIPILSWSLLRGKAACCGTKIDARYFWIELATALGVTAIWMQYSPKLAIIYTVFFCGLIVAAFIDVDHLIIPDEISLGGCLAGLLCSLLVPELHQANAVWPSVWKSFIGLMFGGFLLLSVAIMGAVIFRKEAMGVGDIKLMAAMGAFLGWTAPIFILVVASFIGAFLGIFILIRKKKMFGVRMPFGPYLALGGIIWLFGGNLWMARYMEIFWKSF
jgi:leader peptidase (prepilin peptidase) / N-methyltransferase